VAQRTLGRCAMTVIVPDHAESRRHHQDDQHDWDYHTPDSRLVRHLERIQSRFAARQSSLFQRAHFEH
jgi:hypothetical protein